MAFAVSTAVAPKSRAGSFAQTAPSRACPARARSLRSDFLAADAEHQWAGFSVEQQPSSSRRQFRAKRAAAAQPFVIRNDYAVVPDSSLPNQGKGGQKGPKPITLLGSSGSIGTQTLDIVREHPDKFRVVGLATGTNVDMLMEQIREFKPQAVAIAKEELLGKLKEAIEALPADARPKLVAAGMKGVADVAAYGDAVSVVTGIVGCAGLLPTIAAIEAGKDICLANKETLIAAGPVVVPLLAKHGRTILPADSEHSALFQCIQGAPKDGISKIILTASGGAFRDWPVEKLAEVKPADALKHPNWAMGAKITVDSATMMNKGLEVIEAHYLYGLGYDDIEVVVHPQSIIHSMVEMKDTSVMAQLGWPDMRLPILYTLSWPERIQTSWDRLDLVKCGSLTFRAPDYDKYPCIPLAYEAGRTGGSMTSVLNAANEQAVASFLEEKISYLDIPKVIQKTCEKHRDSFVAQPKLEDILELDAWARAEVLAIAERSATVV
eukprot:tig00000241_g20936.t1